MKILSTYATIDDVERIVNERSCAYCVIDLLSSSFDARLCDNVRDACEYSLSCIRDEYDDMHMNDENDARIRDDEIEIVSRNDHEFAHTSCRVFDVHIRNEFYAQILMRRLQS
jgi:hypothetical protein